MEFDDLGGDDNMPVDRRTTESDLGKKKGGSPTQRNFDEDDQLRHYTNRLSTDKINEAANNASSLRPQSQAQSASLLHDSGMLIDIDKLLKEDVGAFDGKNPLDIKQLRIRS